MLKKMLLKLKWKKDRANKLKSLEIKSPEELLKKRDELYKDYLKFDREEKITETVKTLAKLQALDYVLGRQDTI